MHDTKEAIGLGSLAQSAASPIITIAEPRPYISRMTIHDDFDTEVARLEWPDGKFRFVGDAEESARIFFDGVLKPLVDEYIERRLREEQ